MEKEKIRTRIAPSPTGYLHVGTARTALFNELVALKHNGDFIIRIEDTDTERSESKYEKDILGGLKWLGIEWQEGPDKGGPFGSYRQSERLALYKQAIKKLLEKEAAYLTDEGTIKLRVKEEEVFFEDLIRGKVEIHTKSWGGDFIIARSIDSPVYHLAVVVDDGAQEISHIIRGEEHLTNTARHILIQRALEIEIPKYAHLPLLLGKNRRKLSKRDGNVSLNLLAFRDRGFRPEAMLNYLALLGWNPKNDEEFFTHRDLVDAFSVEGIQKGGAIFDEIKLNSINKYYLNLLDEKQYKQWEVTGLKNKIGGFSQKPEYEQKKWEEAMRTERGRISSYDDIEELICWADPGWKISSSKDAKEMLIRDGKYNEFEAGECLVKLKDFLENINEDGFTEKKLQEKTLAWIDDGGLDRGGVLWPMRVALTGKRHSPGPFEVSQALGKELVIRRLEEAINILENGL